MFRPTKKAIHLSGENKKPTDTTGHCTAFSGGTEHLFIVIKKLNISGDFSVLVVSLVLSSLLVRTLTRPGSLQIKQVRINLHKTEVKRDL